MSAILVGTTNSQLPLNRKKQKPLNILLKQKNQKKSSSTLATTNNSFVS
jgi:hypothetical protein